MAKKYKLPKIEELLNAGVHFGHQVRRWNPAMAPYIFTHKKGIHIIDLEKTEELLEKACEAAYEVASKGGRILFVGTKRQAAEIVAMEAKRSGAMYINERWLGGTVTNFSVIKKNIDKYLELVSKREKGDFSSYTKKERLLIDREIEKLEKFYGGITTLNGKPQLLFIIDAKREKTAIKEAQSADIPVIALIDTNTDPEGIDYIIPGNDDAIRSIAVIVKAIGDAVEEGYKDFEKNKDKIKQQEAAAEESLEDEDPLSDDELEEITVSAAQSPHVTEVSGKKHAKKSEKEVDEEDVEAITEGEDLGESHAELDAPATPKEEVESKEAMAEQKEEKEPKQKKTAKKVTK